MRCNLERNAQIIALRGEGVGPREIARRLGLSPSLVSGALYRAGMTDSNRMNGGRGRGAPEEVKAMVLEAADRIGVKPAARAYGWNPCSIYTWQKERAA